MILSIPTQTTLKGSPVRKEETVKTKYGLVTLEVIHCDGHRCRNTTIESSAVNWLKISPVGLEERTISQSSLEDICSYKCLFQSLKHIN